MNYIFMKPFQYQKRTMTHPILVITTLLLLSTTAFSQEVIRQKSCNDPALARQADSLKTLYEKDGFALLREASMTMESEFEMPVIVPLNQGSLYQFVFIGDNTSRLYEVRMYDQNDKQVAFKQNKWAEIDGNIISFPYRAQFSEFHMMKPVQVNKNRKKNLCGYVMLFKKVK